MLRIESIKNFLGFGDGFKKGEYYFSQGMRRSRRGIKPDWLISEIVSTDDLATMGLIYWFAQRTEDDTYTYIYGLDNAGKIYKVKQLLATWALAHTPTQTGGSHGNGLGVDRAGNIVYAGDRWLGQCTKANPNVYTDDWKDLGSDLGNAWREIFNYEDITMILNGNKVAGYTGDGTDFNNAMFTLPDDFVLKAGKPGKNGILLGANRGNEGYLILWDSYSDGSIAPWIPTDGNVFAIFPYKGNWVAVCGNEVVITNGYTAKHLTFPVETTIQDTHFQIDYPGGMAVKDHYLLLGVISGQLNRRKSGLWILDLETGLWDFCPISTNNLYNAGLGGIFVDDKYTNYIGYTDNTLSKYYIGRITNACPAKSFFISELLGIGDNNKIAEAILVSIGFDMAKYEIYSSISLKITPEVYNFERPLWGYAQSKATGTVLNKIVVDGSVDAYNEAEVGDEITVLEGESAGNVRHITVITGKDTNTETWTLDSNLTALIEDGMTINISPFKKCDTLEITTPETKEYFFNISKKLRGKKFLVKIYLETDQNMTPEILGGSLVYDDLGTS